MVKYLTVEEDADDELSLVDHSTCCILIGCHPVITSVGEMPFELSEHLRLFSNDWTVLHECICH